jgi:adenomatosis polyposis coli protein
MQKRTVIIVIAAFSAAAWIGVQGAGLQWAVFVEADSYLVEIVWQHWPHFFKQMLANADIKREVLKTTDVHLNWKKYEGAIGRTLSEEERAAIQKAGPKNANRDNPWKFADVYVKPDALLHILEKSNLL